MCLILSFLVVTRKLIIIVFVTHYQVIHFYDHLNDLKKSNDKKILCLRL